MNIAYYMPFKPLGHDTPSGDLVIGTELHNFLLNRGHDIRLASTLRCRWIYYRPWHLIRLCSERIRAGKQLRKMSPDLWLTYHSYYKAPDLIGPAVSRKLNIPYAIFQGIYSTKRKRSLKTLPGFLLNQQTLMQAGHIFSNKIRDYNNLKRLIPEQRLSYIAPGIQPELFAYSTGDRQTCRNKWNAGDETIIATAAMMRPGVKTKGLKLVIGACCEIIKKGYKIRLVIIGDGEERKNIENCVRDIGLINHVIFTGMVKREELFIYFSSADIFAFPGIEESLGMVYLEAQSCGLPVVAFMDWGGGEAVQNGRTGLLSPAAEPQQFTTNIERLVVHSDLRRTLGQEASKHIRENHCLAKNYTLMENTLISLIRAD